MNEKKLTMLDTLFENEIKENRIKDCSIQIRHKGKKVFERFYGNTKKETAFKIFSMSKPITSAAAMILIDRGIIDPDDPVWYYIPAFKNMKVMVHEGEDVSNFTGVERTKYGTLVRDAKITMTIRHLLNMTSGMVYSGENSPAEVEMGKRLLALYNDAKNGQKLSEVEICSEMAKSPLGFEPSTRWQYGTSADIMGGVIESASGMKFSEFLKKEIFEPLEMNTTAFNINDAVKEKQTVLDYHRFPDRHVEVLSDELQRILGVLPYPTPNGFEAGGHGLYSTLEDYSRFADMLLHNGTGNGKSLYGRKTAEFQHTPQLKPELSKMVWKDGYNYSNFLRIAEEPGIYGVGSMGEFGWDGLTGTYFLCDQKEDLQIVFMQAILEGTDQNLLHKFRQIVYGALD